MKKLSIAALCCAAALSLTACGNGANENSEGGADTASQQGAVSTFDFSTIKADPEVEALVPAAVKERGVLRNGASTDYPPLEFLLEDGTTPTGAEVDFAKAIALTMGLKDGTTTTETFDALLPKIGSTYDIGASGFTVTQERIANYDMLAYMDMGTQFATRAGNPSNFDPNNVCGTTIGGQTGTVQIEELLPKMSSDCEAAGKEPITIMKEDLLDQVVPKVISGQYDAMVADSPVAGFDVQKSNGQLELIGDVLDAAPVAIVVDNTDQELSKAVAAAMNSLIKSGTAAKIMEPYGVTGLYPEVVVNSVK